MAAIHRNLAGAALAAYLLSTSAYSTTPVERRVESELFNTISTYSLRKVDEKACRHDIQRALNGKSGRSCLGPNDRVLAEAMTEQAVQKLTNPAPTLHVSSPGSWVFAQVRYFGSATADDLYEAIRDSGRRRVILDLRHNGGGRVDQAFKIALWVADPHANQPVYTETRRDVESAMFRLQSTTHHTSELATEFYPNDPDRVGWLRDAEVAILIDEQSFSASEILAEIMRRLNPSLVFLVGHRTYGKWTGQAWFPFTDADGNQRRLIYTAIQYAPGADLTPPAHVEPDHADGFELARLREAGSPNDSVYLYAKRKLIGLLR